MIPLAGVIGDPIAQSRSPQLHGHWLRRYGIAGHYIPLHVMPQNLEATLKLLPDLGFRGVNCTIPHKEAAFRMASEVTDRARAVEAANTLTFTDDGRILADNTDGYGFLQNLRQGAPAWHASRPALILGAGGAARGIVAALLDASVPMVTVANRTHARAKALATLFGPAVDCIEWTAAPARMEHCGLLVNTTSLGMTGQPPLDFDLSAMAGGTTVCDIVYAPLTTPLLADAAARGAQVVDGLGMLLHQAVPGFEQWFGRRPEVDAALRQAVLE